jgi:hypothetical protein
MNVRETPSNATTVTTGTSLSPNVDRKKLKIANTGASVAYVNFSGTAGSSSAFDEKLAAGATLTVENYVGECESNVSVRYVEFT